MLEIMMARPPSQEEVVVPDVFFLWDPAQAKDLMGSAASVAYVGTTSIDSTYQIDGVDTMRIPNNTSGVTITFETPLVLTGLDWTIEWSTINNASVTAYVNELALYSGATGNGMLARYGDAGFGHRLQFGNKFAAAADAYNMAFTKAGSVGLLSHFAMVCKAGVVSVFRNGVKQALAIGTSNTYNQTGFPAGTALTDLRAIRIGWLNSSVTSQASNRGRIRICKNALYTSNYTPVPF